jgi:hypothetical protein
VARVREAFLTNRTFYRFMNEVTSVGTHYFERCDVETDAFLRAKIDLMLASPRPAASRLGSMLRLLERSGRASSVVTHLVNAAFCMSSPRSEADPDDAPDDRPALIDAS